jgi:hypothetical protein
VNPDVLALAATQYGIVRPRDLMRLGLDHNGRRAVLRRLHRVARGVYAVKRPQSPEQVHRLRTFAALMGAPSTAASHVSAAVVHGLPLFRPDLHVVHLVTAGSSRGARSGVHLHPLDAATVRVNGIPATGVARTIIDCARTQSRETAVVMADFALHTRMLTVDELQGALVEAGQAWGISRARTVVSLADGRAESVGETRARLICHDAGIAVTPQVEVRDDTGLVIARVDLGVDGLALGIEFDGAGKYRDYVDPDGDPGQKHWEEKLRNELIEDHGRLLVPVYWGMLDLPRVFIARVRRGMERARRLAG